VDTSVLLAQEMPSLPHELAVSAASVAELHFGVMMTDDETVRSSRLRRLGYVESRFQALPVDGDVAREYGRLAAAVARTGRQPRRRTVDLLIAATAVANGASLYTRNPDDLKGLERLVDIVVV
jgi:predicted nucleic acid-binding protein